MKFAALASLVALVPAFVKAAGSGNPYTGATTFLIPEYVDEVNAAVAKSVLNC
jgi:cellulose 1,4-beta-cellobiosidase